MENNAERFRVTYQQEDVDPQHQLVRDIWVTGGQDPDTGTSHPGCFDPARDLWTPPQLAPGQRFHMVVTADPSPTRFWAIQCWAWVPASRTMHLMDLFSGRADAPDILDWSQDSQRFTGVLEQWWQRSTEFGFPIRTLIVEINAAQRFLVQYDHFRRWRQLRGVALVPHTTGRNKTDEERGLYSLKSEYAHGRVRLPTATPAARAAILPLIDEVTRYPDAATDDQVMAQWFLLWNADRLWPPEQRPPARSPRPSWLQGASSRTAYSHSNWHRNRTAQGRP
jgi:hypothetical protein